MGNEFRGDRRTFLKKGAAVAAGATALPLLTGPRAWAGDHDRGDGLGRLGLVGIDHVGLTVPTSAKRSIGSRT